MVEGEAGFEETEGRSFEELQVALKTALGVITFGDVKNWFKHDGYASI